MPKKLRIEDLDGKLMMTSGVALELGKSRSGVIWLADHGRPPAIRVDGTLVFLRADVEAFARHARKEK